MSIPSRFNPSGAPKERKYIQPIMTSNTTWSNNPSFGMTLSGYNLYGESDNRFAPYKAFDGKNVCSDGWIGAPNCELIITFEKPLKIKSLTIFTGFTGGYTGNLGGTSTGGPGGPYELYGDGVLIASQLPYYTWYEFKRDGIVNNQNSPAQNAVYTLKPSTPKFYKEYKIIKRTAYTTSANPFGAGLRGTTIIDAVY